MPLSDLSVWLDSYRQDLRAALQTAAGQGFRYVQPSAAGSSSGVPAGQLDPRELGESARRHLRKYLRDLGLQVDSIGLLFPGSGLADPAHADERMERVRATLSLCTDLGVRRAGVTLSPGAAAGPVAGAILPVLADWADRSGVCICLHAGADAPETLAAAVQGLDCPLLRLAVDSAALEAAQHLVEARPNLVGEVHLRDVRRQGTAVQEVPAGRGEVDFAALLGALAAAGYGGTAALRRDQAARVDALRADREYIASLLARGVR